MFYVALLVIIVLVAMFVLGHLMLKNSNFSKEIKSLHEENLQLREENLKLTNQIKK